MCIKFIIYIYIYSLTIFSSNILIQSTKRRDIQRNILSMPARLLIFEHCSRNNPPFSSTYLPHLFGPREKTFFPSPPPIIVSPPTEGWNDCFTMATTPRLRLFLLLLFFFFPFFPPPFPLWA